MKMICSIYTFVKNFCTFESAYSGLYNPTKQVTVTGTSLVFETSFKH